MKKSLLLFTAILTVFLFALPVYAADIMLGSRCALADAIIAANHDRAEGDCPAGRGTDTITLTRDITLDGGLPKITSAITIEGNGYTISGNNRYRIFYNDGDALTINNLTMTNGYVEGDLITNDDESLKNATANPIGGAIVNWQGALIIINSSFSNNLAEHDGGAIYNRDGTLSISDSTFSDNLADLSSGAIENDKGTLIISSSAFSGNLSDLSGGAIANSGELSISNSSFSHNSAEWGGAIRNSSELSISDSTFSHNSSSGSFAEGGAIFNWGELSIVNSAFSDNSSEFGGGAIANYGDGTLSISDSAFSGNSAEWGGGAIHNWSELTLRNSTFSGNSAEFGGGAIYNEENENLRLRSSTFSDNSADKGGAIYNKGDGKLRITNSIIVGNGGACYSEGRLRHNINNFIQDGSCSSDFSGDPMLGELIEPEDGSPAYFPLLAGSPAIDAADDDYCPETDQIGIARPQGAGCDIGAIEYVSP